MQLNCRCHLGNSPGNWFCDCNCKCTHLFRCVFVRLPLPQRWDRPSSEQQLVVPLLRFRIRYLVLPLVFDATITKFRCWKHLSVDLMQRMEYLCLNSGSFLVANLLFDLTQEFWIGRLYIRYIIAFRHYSFSAQWIKRFEDDAQTTLRSLRKIRVYGKKLVALIFNGFASMTGSGLTPRNAREVRMTQIEVSVKTLTFAHWTQTHACSVVVFVFFSGKIARIG